MPRMGLGLGLGLVPKILGDGSSNPLPELGLIANYQARFNDLSLIPTNKVAGWDDSASKALGSELFSGFSFFGATWSDNGDGSYTSTGSTNDLMEVQLFTLGEIYEITYTIDSISSGAITPKVGNTQGTRHSEVGTYTEYLICSNGLAFRFVGRNNFIGTVSNLSVKQALSGYNTLTQSTSSQMPTFDTVNEVVSFDTDDNMNGLPPQSGDFSYVFRGIEFLGDISSQNRFLSQQALSTKAYAQNNSIIIQSDQNNFWNIASGQFDLSSQFDLVITLSGSTLSGYQNSELKGSRDIGSDTITLDKIGNINNQSINGTLKEVGVYDRALTLEEIEKI